MFSQLKEAELIEKNIGFKTFTVATKENCWQRHNTQTQKIDPAHTCRYITIN